MITNFYLETLNSLCDHALECDQCNAFLDGSGQDDFIPCDLGRQVFQRLSFARSFASMGTTYSPKPSPFLRGSKFRQGVTR